MDIRIKISSSEKEFDSLNEIFDSGRIHSGDTVTFLTDVTIGTTVSINKKCIIDMNGHYLFIPIPSGVIVKNGVAVRFTNGKIQTLSADQQEDAIIVQGSKTILTLDESVEVDTRGTAIHARKKGQLILCGAKVRSTGSQPTVYVDDAYSSMTMNGGIVASYEKSAIVIRDEGVVVINDGEVHTESNGLVPETSYPAVVVCGKGTKLDMFNGCIFSEKTTAVQIEDAGEFVIHDGTVYTKSNDYTAVAVNGSNSCFKMETGWVYSTKASAILANKMDYGDVQTVSVLNGKVGSSDRVVIVAGPGDHGVLFSGGSVKGYLDPSFVAPGYVVSDIVDEDGYAEIILKTWTSPEDVSPIFPNASADPDVNDNPFDPVFDPEVNVDVIPFPPASIGGDPIEGTASKVVLSTVELPMPYPPIDNPDPYAPSDNSVAPEFPVPVPTDYEPIPEPGPAPFPGPIPPAPHDNGIVYNSSVNIRHKIQIYNTPSRKHPIAEWRGALTIVSGGYYNKPDGDEYAMVKFRVPGSGSISTGYALVYDLAHP